jgi:ATP adenylyltransferase
MTPPPDSAPPDAAPQGDQPGVAVDDVQRLWAPWRYGYVAGKPRIDGCPFCVLPARDDDQASLILHRGEHCFVILNAYPYNPGHLMVVPFEHSDDLGALDEATAQEMWSFGRLAVRVLRERLGCQGVNLGMNLWRAGGAGIADHLHLHAVPRWGGDTNFVSVVGAVRVLPQALDEVYAALAPGFS